jgi:hypothetical protein
MNIKIICHFMPWEIDYALLTYTQLKKTKYHLPDDVNVYVETVLNLSNYTIDWDKTKFPKQYFIDKYAQLAPLLKDYNHISRIHDSKELYGHLDLQRECIAPEIDYYLGICPDIYFSEFTIPYLIESARQITNKYFIITPNISKVGDADWDEITNPKYLDIPYSDYLKVDIFDIRNDNKNLNQDVSLYPTKKSKFAGWFDFCSKSFYEELCPVQEDWVGYGPWDWYSLMITNYVKSLGVDFQQYLLQGETIWMYPSGPLVGDNIDGFSKYYRDHIVFKEGDKHSQRDIFESKMQEYLERGIQTLKNKNII